MKEKDIVLKQVILEHVKCRKKKADKLMKLLETKHIKINGSVTLKCNFKTQLLDIRAQIQQIAKCSFNQIICTYCEKC